MRLRVVLKSALRWEPALDIAEDHLPLCFDGHHVYWEVCGNPDG